MSSYESFAAFYDELTTNVDYETRGAYLWQILQNEGKRSGLLLDLACGTGTLCEYFSARGYDVIGVDASEEMLAEAMEADLPYRISCPALLICGEKDRAGSCVRYNRAWHRKAGISLAWVPHAGHNANTDAPEAVNGLLERFAAGLDRPQPFTSHPGSPCR